MEIIARRVVLKFPPKLIDQPIIYRLVKHYDLEFNILKAYITPREEGLLVLELKGTESNYNAGINYLAGLGIKIQLLAQDIIRNESRCTHCGVCIPICPTGAFVYDKLTSKINFLDNKCIACELCIKACPPKAMEVHF